MTVGYSGTPLPKKLGLKDSTRLLVINEPPDYAAVLGELPPGLIRDARLTKSTTLVHLFVQSRRDLERNLTRLRRSIEPAASIWVSWPKRTSGVRTDVTEDIIREVALPLGLVDIKVCAVSDLWSGLKLVIRKELRAGRAV